MNVNSKKICQSLFTTPRKNRLLNGIMNSCWIYERVSVLFNPFFVWKGLKLPSIFKIKEFHLYWNEQNCRCALWQNFLLSKRKRMVFGFICSTIIDIWGFHFSITTYLVSGQLSAKMIRCFRPHILWLYVNKYR